MVSEASLVLPAPGRPNPEGEGGKAFQQILSYARDGAGDRDDVWAFMSFAMAQARRSKAQLFQDLWALWVADGRRRGYFVEFGATDGVYLSNTWLLEKEFGWTGVLAEPNPVYGKALRRNRGCAVSTLCVHSVTGRTVDFLAARKSEFSRIYDIAPGDSHEDRRSDGAEVIPVQTISLNDLLRQRGAPKEIDFLSIDTEGSEHEILSALDFDRWRPRALAVEHNFTPMREPLFELMTARGYHRMWPGLSRYDDWYVLD